MAKKDYVSPKLFGTEFQNIEVLFASNSGFSDEILFQNNWLNGGDENEYI